MTVEQKALLIEQLEANYEVLLSDNVPSGRKQRFLIWTNIAAKLNNTLGPSKPVTAWMRVNTKFFKLFY